MAKRSPALRVVPIAGLGQKSRFNRDQCASFFQQINVTPARILNYLAQLFTGVFTAGPACGARTEHSRFWDLLLFDAPLRLLI
jgi:hypothetical protein